MRKPLLDCPLTVTTTLPLAAPEGIVATIFEALQNECQLSSPIGRFRLDGISFGVKHLEPRPACVTCPGCDQEGGNSKSVVKNIKPSQKHANSKAPLEAAAQNTSSTFFANGRFISMCRFPLTSQHQLSDKKKTAGPTPYRPKLKSKISTYPG
jgi:hypothetical protein